MATRTRSMSDPTVRASKHERRYAENVRPLNEYVDELRNRPSRAATPYVDPDCGGVNAQLLFLLQDPSATAENAEFISWDNDDPTAAMCAEMFDRHGIERRLAVPWNAVPWPSSLAKADRNGGRAALARVLTMLPDVRVAMVLGGTARDVWKELAASDARARSIRAVNGPHPAGRGLTNGGRQTKAEGLVALDKAFADAAIALDA
jgi:hypothetical protein